MPLAITLMAAILILAITIFSLYFRHRRQEMWHQERVLAMEKGLPLPDSFWEPTGLSQRAYLLRGLIWIVVGIGTSVWFAAMWFAEGKTDNELLAMATLGIIPIGVGAAYLVVMGRKSEGEPPAKT